jgi:DNA-binding response OmpR family regulator
MSTPKILVLTSNETVGSIIAYRLDLLGNSAYRVPTPDQLEAVITGSMPDLVIIDLNNSEGSGIALVEKLSTDIRTCNVSIMCLSAEGDLTLADTANRAGSHDFLVVPFDMLLLEQKVHKLVTRSKELRAKSESQVAGAK